jgi:hypothetical protein
MKCITSITAASSLMWLAGCASAPIVAVSKPVGPAPASQAQVSDQGYLEVYSARLREDARTDLTQWEWDYPLDRNAFTCGLAHTDYIIRTAEGLTFRYVRNATDPADPYPTLVSLPPGRYKVQAETEEADGRLVTVMLPVHIAGWLAAH